MRKVVFGVGLVAALALLYAAAGYWLAPGWVLDALQRRAAEVGATLRVEDVRTDPFALEVVLAGAVLDARSGARLAAAKAIRVKLAWSSLWSDAWTIDRASLEAPTANLSFGPQGPLNRPGPGKSEGRGTPLEVRELAVSGGQLKLSGAAAELAFQDVALKLRNFSTRAGREAQYRLSARLVSGGALESQGTIASAPLSAHGKVSINGAPLQTLWQLAQRPAPAVSGDARLQTTYAYEAGKLSLHDTGLVAARAAYAGVALEQASLHVPELTIPPRGPIKLAAEAELRGGGRASARGSVQPQPLAGELELEVRGVPLAVAGRFLPATAGFRIARGAVTARGTMHLGPRHARYEGSASVQDLRLEERDSANLVLAWQSASTASLKFALEPMVLEIGELRVQAPQGRLIIDKDGKVNLVEALRGKNARQGPPPQISVRRLFLENGTLQFADRSLATPFEATIEELSGGLSGLSTGTGEPARLQLTGKVEKYGSVRIGGTIDLGAPRTLANIRAQFRNIDLAQLTPYVVKFAGYRVRSGRVSADLRYRVRDARLIGENRLAFQHLELGEKVQRAGAADLPLELAVALLSDAEGRINLDIPVTGNLNDPKFDFGGLVARALGNTIGRIVSAPFRALAGLFGRGADKPDAVRFEPGSAALSPPEEENAAQLAKLLAARPQLGVQVRPSFDPERDSAALRVAAARREIARRAGYETAGPLDFNDPRVLEAAEKLYLGRVGNRLELQALRDRSPRYGRALVDALAATVDVSSPEQLARERAQAVREALIDHGVDAARIVTEPPAARSAEQNGIATQLALTAEPGVKGGDASVGASAR